VVDYFIKSAASSVTVEIFDAQKTLVSKFSSEDKRPEKRPPLPIAERWFPKPERLQTNPGMHRFLWNLTWGSSGGPAADEDSEYRNPNGPEVVPGIYQVRLTVDGETQSQDLKVILDPRSPATPEVLQQQLQIGQQAYAETLEARRALAEIASVQKHLADVEQKLGEQNSTLKSALADAQSEIAKILSDEKASQQQPGGLQDGYSGLASALRVIEGGDRAVPSQAVALYQESSQRAKEGIAKWATFKQTKLPQVNQKLREGKFDPIAIWEIEQEVQFLMSR
jgi:hypothetical protein